MSSLPNTDMFANMVLYNFSFTDFYQFESRYIHVWIKGLAIGVCNYIMSVIFKVIFEWTY